VSARPPIVVGLGEVLWDRFPDGDRLGGAPANVAFHASQLGAKGIVASRIGTDSDGDRLAAELAANGLGLEAVQRDPEHSTGVVRVTVSDGEPAYVIERDSAWDHIEFTPEWEALAAGADAVCFGTLAQRNEPSRRAIQAFVAASKKALRLFDVNLRQSYYSPETIRFGLSHSAIVKLNEKERDAVAALLGWRETGEAASARFLAEFPLEWIAVTRGARGCELRSRNQTLRAIAPRVTCIDAVGAGDSFSAALLVGLLAGTPPQDVIDHAVRVGAYVATQHGAMPPHPSLL